MKNDKEFEMLLSEIPHAASFSLLQQQHNNHQHHQQHHHGHGINGNHGYGINGSHGSSPTERAHVQGHGHGHGHGMYGMYDDDPSSHHHKYQPVSPVNGFTLQSEGSSSSLGWFSSDDGSPRPSTLDEIKPQTPFINSHYFKGLRAESKTPDDVPLGRNSSVENLFNEMGRMNIRDEIEDVSMNKRFRCGLQFSDPSPLRTEYGNVDDNGVFDNNQNGFSDLRRVNCSFPTSPRNFEEERRSALLGLQRNHQMGGLSGSRVSPGQYDSLFSGHSQYVDPISFQRHQTMEETLSNLQLQADAHFGGNYRDMGIRVPYTAPSVYRPSMSGNFLYHQQNPTYSYRREGIPNILASHMTQPRMTLGMENLMNFNLPMFNGRTNTTTIESIPHSPPPVDSSFKLEAFNCEDSIIIQGKGLHYVIKKRRGRSKEHRNEIGLTHMKERSPELADRLCSRGTSVVNCGTGTNRSMCSPLPLKYNSMMNIRDYIYSMAKDQHGCRFLQQTFDEGSPQDKQLIFQEIIDHVVELMMNPFGNYLVQKMLEKGNTEQRMKILLMVTSRPGELVRISLNVHGTRAVQKLINSLRTQEEKSVVISALEPGILDLIMDLNGNHVLQHCLQHLQKEENKFIFAAVTKFCCEIAMHRHGCCVLQRCIAYATEEDQNILVSKVVSNALRLTQDAFGNYVIQYVLELKIPSANATLMSQFEGNYVLLSTQKFSSNVIEKCLKVFREEDHSVIINEFISSPQFENLIQDQYGNYVIQSALKVSKGPLNAALIEAIRPYGEVLKNNPYFKRIFSWTCSKK